MDPGRHRVGELVVRELDLLAVCLYDRRDLVQNLGMREDIGRELVLAESGKISDIQCRHLVAHEGTGLEDSTTLNACCVRSMAHATRTEKPTFMPYRTDLHPYVVWHDKIRKSMFITVLTSAVITGH